MPFYNSYFSSCTGRICFFHFLLFMFIIMIVKAFLYNSFYFLCWLLKTHACVTPSIYTWGLSRSIGIRFGGMLPYFWISVCSYIYMIKNFSILLGNFAIYKLSRLSTEEFSFENVTVSLESRLNFCIAELHASILPTNFQIVCEYMYLYIYIYFFWKLNFVW